MRRYQWVLLGLLVCFWGLVGVNRLGIGYIFPIIIPAFHMPLWQASLCLRNATS